MNDVSNFEEQFSQDTSYFEDDELKSLTKFALRIQLAATGIATSFILLFVPNVETITILSFLFGFLFPTVYALSITLTMIIGWELLLTMVISFSGITFFFKLVAWCLITLLGSFARKIKITNAYEFGFFGFLSALLFDFIVTLSIPLVFITDEGNFTNVLIAALVFGIPFTISHVISNSLLFSFFPKITKGILPILNARFSHILKIRRNHFENGKRFGLAMFVVFLLMFAVLGIGTYRFVDDMNSDGENILITIQLHISYGDVMPDNHFEFDVNTSLSVLEVTQSKVNLSVKYFYGLPYVEAINGVKENNDLSNHFWIFYIDNVKSLTHAGTSLSNINVINGSVILWNYESAN
ncbi:MAG: DUF4430 domain-containing protein [Candidatus Heimdallarchaeota archaeon]|nr:DUF4430 domain-containing protein [Candidatus Heimdallarchaeota archaeon]